MTSRIVVSGATGFIGSRVVEAATAGVGVEVCAPGVTGPRIDLAVPGAWAAYLEDKRPTAVIHLAAVTSIAGCDRDPGRAERINVDATREISHTASRLNSRLVFASTDQVFDGRPGALREDAAVSPLHHYGRTKAAAEAAVLEDAGCVARLGLVFGRSPSGERSASESVLAAIAERRAIALYEDEFRRPVAAGWVAECLLLLALCGRRGPAVCHLAGPERVSRHAFGMLVARVFGLSSDFILPARSPSPGSRPRDLDLVATSDAPLESLSHGSLSNRLLNEHRLQPGPPA